MQSITDKESKRVGSKLKREKQKIGRVTNIEIKERREKSEEVEREDGKKVTLKEKKKIKKNVEREAMIEKKGDNKGKKW